MRTNRAIARRAGSKLKIKEVRTKSRVVAARKKLVSKAKPIIKKAKALSPAKKEQLILDYRHKAKVLAHSMMRRWRSHMDMGELESIVDLSLCEAVQRFDPNRGVSFMTFLFYHLKGNLVRTVTSAAENTHIPIIDGEMSDSANEGYKYGVTAKEISEQLQFREQDCPETLLLKKEACELTQGACKKLDPLEQEIVGRLYGKENQVHDIAQNLGYSRCHISRVKRNLLNTLYSELAPDLREGAAAERPNFEEDESHSHKRYVEDSKERRQTFRRRPRSNSAQHEKRLLLVANSR